VTLVTWELRTYNGSGVCELADLAGIALDLETAVELCRRLRGVWEVSPVDAALVDALSTAIVVRYSRCFAEGIRARIPPEFVDQLSPELQSLHRRVQALRNKHVAHSVNPLEENLVIVRLAAPPDPPTLGLIEIRRDRLLGLDSTTAAAVHELCQTLFVAVSHCVEAKKKVLQHQLESLPLDSLYGLPEVTAPARGWEEVEGKRQQRRRRQSGVHFDSRS
jgi:hypothetical protein